MKRLFLLLLMCLPVLTMAQLGNPYEEQVPDTVYIQYLSVSKERFSTTLSHDLDMLLRSNIVDYEHRYYEHNGKIRCVLVYWGQMHKNTLYMVQYKHDDAYFINPKNGWRITYGD